MCSQSTVIGRCRVWQGLVVVDSPSRPSPSVSHWSVPASTQAAVRLLNPGSTVKKRPWLMFCRSCWTVWAGAPRWSWSFSILFLSRQGLDDEEEALKIHKTWYPALKMFKVKPPITKSSDIETDQSGFSCPSAGQSRSTKSSDIKTDQSGFSCPSAGQSRSKKSSDIKTDQSGFSCPSAGQSRSTKKQRYKNRPIRF